MRRVVSSLVPLLILGAGAYFLRAPLFTFTEQAYRTVAPCSSPLTYSIGSVDPRFGVSTTSAIAATKAAIGIWDTAAGHTFFEYVPTGGEVTVNFVYDDRQRTTTKLKSIGITISSDKAAYDTLHAEYQKLYVAYTAEKADFDSKEAAIERDAAAYEAEVKAANARGGATPEEYDRLQAEKADILARQAQLKTLQAQVNTDADDVNAMITTLNRLASTVNSDASNYNSTAQGQGEEFEEAVYTSAPGKEEIDVYEFDSQSRLIRVLAHEFGHALGLEHVDDKNAIMYRLNQSTNQRPSASDMAELDLVCHFK